MASDYINIHDGGFFVTGTRVSLDSIVYAYLRGESPEGIAESFPALSLDQVFGSLAYYVVNRETIDKYLAVGRADFESLRQQWRTSHPSLYAKLVEARQKLQSHVLA